MNSRRSAFGTAAILAAGLLETPLYSGMRAQAINADNIWIQASVVDSEGRHLSGFGSGDFAVHVDARRYPTTIVTQHEPVAIALMLDVSRSMAQDSARVRSAVRVLIDRLAPGDRINIGAFDSRVRVSDRFTASSSRLVQILEPPGILANVQCNLSNTLNQSRSNLEMSLSAGTALWPAVQCAVRELVKDGETARRILILVTDGYDNSRPGFEDAAMTVLQRSGVLIYVIGVPGSGGIVDGGTEARLRRLADETGGRYFLSSGKEAVGAAFLAVVEELRAQYLLGFQPDRRSGSITVSVAKPGARVRARSRFAR